MHSANESEFNKKWNWLLLCKTIAEWLTEPYYTTLHRNLFEVLTFATLIKEQVEILKSKTKIMATPDLQQASRRSQQESRLAALDSLGTDRSEFLTEELFSEAELVVGEFIERVKANMQQRDLIVTGKIEDMRIEHDTKENKINIWGSGHILWQDRGVNGSQEKKYNTPHEYSNLRPPSSVFEDYVRTKNIQLRNNENYEINGGSPFSDMDGDDKAIQSAAYAMATKIFKEGFKPQKFFAVEIPQLITDLKKVIPNFVTSNIVQQINAKASDQLFTGRR